MTLRSPVKLICYLFFNEKGFRICSPPIIYLLPSVFVSLPCNTTHRVPTLSGTRIKPFSLANGHGRYITVTPERALVSVGGWLLHIKVIILWPFCL
jgi:hypothetical protein